MCATFQSEGTVPESMDFWNRTVTTPQSSSAHIFNNFPGKPSGPGALFSLMPKRSFRMPLQLIEMLLIWAAEPYRLCDRPMSKRDSGSRENFGKLGVE